MGFGDERHPPKLITIRNRKGVQLSTDTSAIEWVSLSLKIRKSYEKDHRMTKIPKQSLCIAVNFGPLDLYIEIKLWKPKIRKIPTPVPKIETLKLVVPAYSHFLKHHGISGLKPAPEFKASPFRFNRSHS